MYTHKDPLLLRTLITQGLPLSWIIVLTNHLSV